MSNLKRYAVSLVLLVFAAVVFLVGILAVTVWKPAQYIVASGESSAPYVMTRTGVLPLYSPTVTVTVTAQDPTDKVWMAIGSAQDIKGWLADRPYDEVIGLEDLRTLKFLSHGVSGESPQSGEQPQSGESEEPQSDVAAEQAQSDESIPDVDPLSQNDPLPTGEDQSEEVDSGPIASDMWISLREGHGTIELELLPSYGEASLLIASDEGGAAPQLTLTWSYPQPNILGWTAFSLAVAIVLLAAMTAWVTRRRQSKRKTRAAQILIARQADVTETAALPAITDDIVEGMAEATPAIVEDVAVEKVERSSILSDQRFAPAEPADLSEEPLEEEPEASSEAVEKIPAEIPEDSSEETPEKSSAEPQKPVEESGAIPIRTESVSTESGMINLSALQGGGAFPTRRALREAQARGVQSLIVEGREFHTGSTPVVAAAPEVAEATDAAKEAVSEVLGKRSTRTSSWGSIFTKQKRSADEANNQTSEPAGDKGDADE